MQYFGDRLKDLRQAKRLTQTQLAEKLGLTGSTISAYEQGRKYPSVDVLINLCTVLDISSDYMLGLSDSMKLVRSYLTDEQISLVRKLIYELEQYNYLKDETGLSWENEGE